MKKSAVQWLAEADELYALAYSETTESAEGGAGIQRSTPADTSIEVQIQALVLLADYAMKRFEIERRR